MGCCTAKIYIYVLLYKVQCGCMGVCCTAKCVCKVVLKSELDRCYVHVLLSAQNKEIFHMTCTNQFHSILTQARQSRFIVSRQPLRSLFACGWVLLFVTHCQQMLHTHLANLQHWTIECGRVMIWKVIMTPEAQLKGHWCEIINLLDNFDLGLWSRKNKKY